jgi:hypothetical protein
VKKWKHLEQKGRWRNVELSERDKEGKQSKNPDIIESMTEEIPEYL